MCLQDKAPSRHVIWFSKDSSDDNDVNLLTRLEGTNSNLLHLSMFSVMKKNKIHQKKVFVAKIIVFVILKDLSSKLNVLMMPTWISNKV